MSEQPKPDTSEFVDPLSDFEPTQYSCELERALCEETVQSIQSRPYAQISPSSTVRAAIKTMRETEVASLLIVDSEGRLLGLFTERDVLERVAERYDKLADRSVAEVMTPDPTVVYETDPAAAALAAIAVAGHRHVPVLSVGATERVVGVISPRRAFDFIEAHDQS